MSDKYSLIRKKRDEMRNRRQDRINRRTFPDSGRIFGYDSNLNQYAPNRFQMDLQDTPQPEIVIDDQEVDTMIIAHLPITEEVTYEISSSEEMQIQIETACSSPAKIEQVEETLISAKILAQAEDLRKLMLLQDTIKRFLKKK